MADVCWYVSPAGNDTWSGRLPAPNAAKDDGPFRTLQKASAVVQPGQTCYLRQGVYRETLTAACSGTPDSPIVFRNYPQETPVISGADVLTGWQPDTDTIMQAPMDWTLAEQNQVFADGVMLHETRWPHNPGTLLQPARAAALAGTETSLTDPNLPATVTDWTGALLWCAGGDRWVCWSEQVTGYDAATRTLAFTMADPVHWYTVRPGSPYVLMGARATLEAAGEWWYDTAKRRLLLIPPEGVRLDTAVIEAKRRLHCIDLCGRSDIQLIGLHFRAGGVLTDDATTRVRLLGCTGSHVAHSYVSDVAETSGVLINGHDNEVSGCELAWSSTSVLRVRGQGHRIVNNYIHDGNYAGKWSGTVALAGRKILFSHNTVRHSGRDLVSIYGLMESLFQYNDLSDAGWLTCDLGLTYGHNTDFMNTVIRYNAVHDNHAAIFAMGIYFDHCSHNVIVHHNLIYGTYEPVHINNPSYFDLVLQNSCYQAGGLTTFDHSDRNDLFGVRLANNIVNEPISLPAHVVLANNLVSADPGYVDPAAQNFTLAPDAAARKAGQGALAADQAPWRVGHDFAHPPTPVWEAPQIDWMNTVFNACFELGTLEGWTPTGPGEATIAPGNGWGNPVSGSTETVATGTSKYELRLSNGRAGVQQTVTGLHPNTPHTFSAWLKVSAPTEAARLGVSLPDGQTIWSPPITNTDWTRVTLDFTTGPAQHTATILVEKTTDGPGEVNCDNLGLPRAVQTR